MIGEIGGSAEEEAAEYIKKNFKKPVVGFHCRPNSTTGTAYGTCRRHHFAGTRHSCGKDGEDERLRHPCRREALRKSEQQLKTLCST